MFCKKCGSGLPEGQSFCPYCGHQDDGISKGLKISIVVACFVVLTVVIGVVLWMTFGPKNAGPAEAPFKPTVEATEPAETTTSVETTTSADNAAKGYTVESDVLLANKDVVVAQLGDYQLTVAQLQMYYWFQVAQYYNNNREYIYYGQIALDLTAPLESQPCTENPTISWQQFFLQKAINTWRTHAMVNMMADEEGYELPADTMENMKADFLLDAQGVGFETVEEYVKDMLKKNVSDTVTTEEYWEYMEFLNRSTTFFAQWYESQMPTDDELEAYYIKNEDTFVAGQVGKDAGNIVDVRHILFKVKNGDWASAEKKANEALQKWKDGGATEDVFAQLANELSEDGGSNTNGGLYTQVVPGRMVEVFNDWIMDDARKPGDTAILKADYYYQGYHVMYFVSGSPIWKEAAIQQILTERSTAMAAQNKEKWPFEQYDEKIMLGTPVFE